ncbi:uncharacterized protein N0V89_007885 [Didymosphaeria variabile]|uniref:Small secreted protein n=1 Tax=Didymosphaeria variabile TaxID=1932322 RepID=A0A9W8XLP8_9PLEO|nr:uncharacterized protein N0V89_007885 [Didymosphaeria variabile]KAJ4352536.1 hypothetical protein N0V89_007885 [Didymosphaeria variabile]
MHFSAITVLSLSALSVALPTKRQDGASVLGNAAYNDISISGGVAGNAEAEALAVFANLDTANPENISADDQDTLNQVNQVANDAETEAFNPAIEAATGDEAQALENGKIKNKVLKLEATILKLQAQQAQGEDVADKLAEEQTKLDNNIAQDVAAAGQASTALEFDAQITGAGPALGDAAAGGNDAAAAAGGNATDDAAADDAAAAADEDAAAAGKKGAAASNKKAAAAADDEDAAAADEEDAAAADEADDEEDDE